MVSVGLSPTPERKKAISFSRAVRAVRADPGGAEGRHDARRRSRRGTTRTRRSPSLQGSTGASSSCRRCSRRPSSKSFPDQNAAFLEVATGRADGIVVENYLLAQFNKSNGNKLEAGRRSRSRCTCSTAPTRCRRATRRSSRYLNKFICSVQKNGQLAEIYKQTEGATLPPMPPASESRRRDRAARVAVRRGSTDSMTARDATTSSSSAAGPPGSRPPPRRAAPGSRSRLVDERPTLGGQIFKQPGPGFRVTRPRGARPRPPARPRADRRGRALAARALLLRTSCVSIAATRPCSSTEGERARTVAARRVLLAPGAHDRPVVFPGWTLPGVLTAGGAQTLVKTQRVAPGERHRVRRQRPARARVPGAAPPLRRERRRWRSRPGRRPGPRDVAAARSRRRAATCALLRDAVALPQRSSCAAACRCATGGSSCAAEGDGRVEAVVHAAVDADWRVVPGQRGARRGRRALLGYGFFPSVELLRLAGCELRATTRISAARSSCVDAWQRTTVAGHLGGGRRHRRRRARTSRSTRAGSPRSARRSTSARSRRPTRPTRGGARSAPAGAEAGASASALSPAAPRRPRHLRAGRPPTPSSAAARRSRAPSSTAAIDGHRRHQRRQGLHARRRWASARGATASGRSPR